MTAFGACLRVLLTERPCSGTSGLGKETILALARSEPSRIYFTGRNSTAAANVISEAEAESAARNPSLKLTFLECDHTSFPSVENAIRQFLSETQRLDVLLCNAGVMGTDPSLTRDGYENQFGINQMAHTLMIKMLLPILQSTAQMTGDVRVVFESSIGFRWTPSGGIRLPKYYCRFRSSWRHLHQSLECSVELIEPSLCLPCHSWSVYLCKRRSAYSMLGYDYF